MADIIQNIKATITNKIVEAIQYQLTLPRQPRTFDGQLKPTSGKYLYTPKPKNLTGTLSNSVQAYWTKDLENNNTAILVVDFGEVNYWYYVDQGREPGVPIIKRRQVRKQNGQFGKAYNYTSFTKMPPLDKIREWVQARPALTPIQSLETRTFLAARSIARDGIYGINFVEKALKQVENEIVDMFGDYASYYLRRYIGEKLVIVPEQ